MLDSRDALVVLADTIAWDYFNIELERYYYVNQQHIDFLCRYAR